MTHPPHGWWVLCFQEQNHRGLSFGQKDISKERAGGEVVNAQVCKTCIRGFDPRPALH